MTISETTITTKAEHTTDNGYYQIEYSITDNALKRFVVTIYTAKDSASRLYLGQITYENGNVHSMFENVETPSALFIDYEQLIATVKSELKN